MDKFPNASASDALNIQARPSEHEAIIRRQGQVARVIQARKCPCIEGGVPDLHCTVCDGKGYIFQLQKSLVVIDENSDHCDGYEVYPFGKPVIRGINVIKKHKH